MLHGGTRLPQGTAGADHVPGLLEARLPANATAMMHDRGENLEPGMGLSAKT